MSCIRRFRPFSLFRRGLAVVLIGTVVLLGVSACLTRGGGEASSSAGVIAAAATRSDRSDDVAAGVAPRRCAFALFSTLPDRRAEPSRDAASRPIVWRLADARAVPQWAGRVLERPPRDATLA